MFNLTTFVSLARKSKLAGLRRKAALAALATMISVPAVQGATGTWIPDANGGWGNPANWTGGIPNGIDDVANLTANLTANRVITLEGSRTLGSLTIGDPTSGYFAYTVTANGQGGQLIFDVLSGDANLTFASAANTVGSAITAPIILNDSLVVHALNTGGNVINGNISGTGGLTLTTDGSHPAATSNQVGQLTLTGYNTFSGGLTVAEGTLTANSTYAVGTGAINVGNGGQIYFNAAGIYTSDITIKGFGWNQATHGQFGALRSDSGGTSYFTGSITLADDARFAGTGGTTVVNGVVGETGGSQDLQINQLLSGAAASNSTWVFNNTNTYTGKTTVNMGTLRVGNGGTTGSLGGTSALEFGNANIEFRRSDNVTVTTPFAQLVGPVGGVAITGSNFTHSGNGVLTLDNNASAYTGTTTVNGTNAKLVFGSGGAYAFSGAGTITLTNGSDIEFNTSSAVALGNIVGGTNSYVIQSGSGTTTLGGDVNNGNTWATVNGGKLVLNKASTATVHAIEAANALGLVVNNGTVQLRGDGGNDQISTQTDVRLNGGTLDLNGSSEGFDVLAGNGGVVLNSAATTTSTLTLGEHNSTVNQVGSIAYGTTFGGAIQDGAGIVAVTKVGTGLQTLSGPNTYTGATSVNAGVLSVTGSTPAAGTVLVNSTGTLSGTGTVGHVTLGVGGSIRPGATNLDTSAGMLTANSLMVNGGDIRLAVGTGGDVLAVNNSVNFTAASTITPIFTSLPASNTSIPLIAAGGGVTTAVQPTLSLPATTRSTFALTTTVNTVDLTISGPAAKSLTWTGAGSSVWDLNATANFSGGGTETFYNLDAVTFGDQALNRTVTVLPNLAPTTVTVNNSTGNDYIFVGSAITGGGASLTKTGTGTLSLNAANTFGGNVNITGGIVKTGNGGALGDTGGQTFVSAGGTLDVNGQNLGAEVINISGTGVGGNGALINTGAQQTQALRFVTLTGDAAVGGTGRFDIRANGGGEILDLAGFTLTKSGTNTFAIVGATRVTDGNIVVNQGDFQIETGATVQGSGTLTWNAGTRATFYQSQAALVTRNMVWNGITVDTIGQNSSVGSNITLGGDATFVATGNTLTLSGNLSETGGPRSIIKNNGGALTLTGNNTFTGGITITGGTVNLNGTNTVAGPVSVASGTLSVNSSITTAATLGNASSIELNSSTLNLSLLNNYTLPSTTMNASTITFAGQTQGSTLSINSSFGSTIDSNVFNVNQGTATLQGGASLTLNLVNVGRTPIGSGNVGTLNVTTGAAVTTRSFFIGEGGGNTGFVNQSGGAVSVLGTDPGADGIMRIGHYNGTAAFYNLSGGTFSVPNGTTSIGIDGANASLNISGGTATLYRLLVDGRASTGPIGGNLNLSGGELVIGSGGLGNTGNGQVNLSGGTLSASATTTFSAGMNLVNNATILDTRGNLVTQSGTLFGPGGFTKVGDGRLVLSSATNNLAGTVNANAGELYITGALTSAAATVNANAGSAIFLDGTGTNPAAINGTVNVNSGALLSGFGNGTTTGKVGNLNIAADGEIRPGFVVGTLSAGTMNMSGGKARFDLSGSVTTTGGVANDLIAVSGNLSFTGGTILPSFTSAPASGNTYTLFTSAGLTGLPAIDPSAMTSRLAYAIAAAGGNVTLTTTGTAKSLVWTGANGGTWDLNSAQNWTDGGAETFYQADSVTFDGTAPGAITLAGGLQPIATTVNSSADYTFSGTGSIDTGNLTKTGTGKLTVLNTNAYAGGTTITEGVLSFAQGALGSGGPITMNGGTLQWNGANTQDVSSRVTMLASKVATFDTNGNTLTLIHPLGNSTSGGLTKTGAGTLVLAGNNTYTGPTTVQGGVLQIGNGELTGTVGSGAGTLNINGGATLRLFRRGTVNPLNNAVSGTGTIELKGDGTATNGDYAFGGNNSTFNGNIALNLARLTVDNANDLGLATVTVNSGSGVLITAGGPFNNALTIQGIGWLENGSLGALRFASTANPNWTGPVTLSGDARINANGATENGTISGVISGSGSLSKTGLGTITIAGNASNTFTGAMIVPNVGSGAFAPLVLAKTAGNAVPGDLQIGTLTPGYATAQLGASEQIADTGVVSFNGTSGNWAYFKMLGFNETVGGLSSPLVGGVPVLSGVIETMEAEVVNTTSTLTVNTSADYAYNGYMRDRASGAGTGLLALTKDGAGTQTLIGANVAYTGTTKVNGGVLKLENTTAWASSIENEATVEISAPTGSNYLLGNGKTYSGAGTWIKTGEGRVRLGNGIVNATGEIIVQAGILANDNNSANWAGSSANLTVHPGATFDIRADSARLNKLSGEGTVTNSYGIGNGATDTLTIGVTNGSSAFTGRITDGGAGSQENRGGLALRKEGTGTQVLTGTNTYSGITTVANGTLRVGDGGTTGALGTNAVVNDGTLVFNRSNNHIVNNSISGAGTLVKEGAGTMVLNSANAYLGATTIAAGTLQLGASGALPIPAGIWLDATDGASINTAAGAVTSWNNKGTMGAIGNAVAPTGQEPSFIGAEVAMNGQPVIHFDAATGGVGPFDRLTNGIDFSSSNVTIIYAGRLTGGANFRMLSGLANNWLLGTHGGLSDRGHLGASSAFVDQGGVTANTGAHIYTSTNSTTGMAAFSADTILRGSNTGGYSGPNGLSLGGGFSNAGLPATTEFSDADIGELLVFNSVLSEEDRRAVEAYLSRKWKGIGSTNVLPTSTAVSLTTAGAALDVNGVTQTVGSIAGVTSTAIALGGGSLTTGGDNSSTTFDGAISGDGTIRKVGTGTWTLGGVNTNTGSVMVEVGTLIVNGSLSGANTIVDGGTLRGDGALGALTLEAGAIEVGNSAGILETGDLALLAGTLGFDIFGTTPGAGYDQINVAGGVSIGGPIDLTIDLGVFDPIDNGSQFFTLISNNLTDAIGFDFASDKAFRFAGATLNEGDHFFVGSQDFSISYAGGAGNNDVVITAIPEPGAATSLLGGLALLMGVQRRRRN